MNKDNHNKNPKLMEKEKKFTSRKLHGHQSWHRKISAITDEMIEAQRGQILRITF
jgi:hypothetical protein